jgi:hypothetical protein
MKSGLDPSPSDSVASAFPYYSSPFPLSHGYLFPLAYSQPQSWVALPYFNNQISPCSLVNKSSPGDKVVTFMITVQQIMTGPKTTEREDECFVIIIRTTFWLVMRKYRFAFAVCSAHFASMCTSDPSSPQQEGTQV